MAMLLRSGPVTKISNKPKTTDDSDDHSSTDTKQAETIPYATRLRTLLLNKRVALTFAAQGFVLPLLELNSLIPLFLVPTPTPPTRSRY